MIRFFILFVEWMLWSRKSVVSDAYNCYDLSYVFVYITLR